MSMEKSWSMMVLVCVRIYIKCILDEEKDKDGSGQMRRFESDPDGFGFSFGDVSSYNGEKYGSYEAFNKGFQSSAQQVSMCFDGNDVIRSTLLGLQGGYEKDDSLGSYSISYNQSNDLSSKSSWHNNQRNYLLEQRLERDRILDNRGILLRMPLVLGLTLVILLFAHSKAEWMVMEVELSLIL
ncbi:hypothetical protein CRYUN_Cryun30bG0060900 [Craigia yunnanensis]